MRAHGKRNSDETVRGDQTRRNYFYMIDHATCPGQKCFDRNADERSVGDS